MPATASKKQKPAHAQAETVVHLSIAERVELGKRAREQAPRSSHAGFEAGPDRPDPVKLLEEQARSRVPELVPIRYGRMLVSPFTFYRGAARVMAQDLSTTPARACGCSAAATPTCPTSASSPPPSGAWCSTSTTSTRRSRAVGVGRQATRGEPHDRRPGQRLRRPATPTRWCSTPVAEYREAMRSFAAMENLEVWYARLDVEAFMREYGPQFKSRTVARAERTVAKARTRDSVSALAKLTERVNGSIRIVDQAPLIVRFACSSPARSTTSGSSSSTSCCAPTGAACSSTAGCCWRSSSWRTSPARSWASGAWGPAPGSRCCSAATSRTRCSCR